MLDVGYNGDVFLAIPHTCWPGIEKEYARNVNNKEDHMSLSAINNERDHGYTNQSTWFVQAYRH